MIYRDNDIPEGYNNIAEISDNYLVWVRESSLMSGTKYSAYIQYISPSTWLVFTDDYMISSGTDYEYVPHYTSGGTFSYIDYYDVDYTRTTMSVDDDFFATDTYSRGDAPILFLCQLAICIVVIWILNQLSKLFHKGGVFSN